MRDSSNETFAESQSNSAAPVAEPLDSYRELPDRAEKELGENSQATLNLRLRHAGPSPSGQPRDFTFLIGSGRGDGAAAPAALAPGGGGRAARPAVPREDELPSSQESQGALKPEASQHNLARSARRPALPAVRDVLARGADGAPSDFSFLLDVVKRQAPLLEEEPSAGSGGEAPEPTAAAAGPSARRRNNRKRRQATLAQGGSQKRPREGGHSNTDEGSGQPGPRGPSASGGSGEDGTGDGEDLNMDTAGAGPQVCGEESMLHRLDKRATLIEIIKRSPEYAVFTATRPPPELEALELEAGESLAVPRTPNAADRTISKRRWEEEVRNWRLALRQWQAKNTP